ncbi:MAG TPA: patatin-like phospholipase family protein [Bacteroidales bacterium]|nr:patatin-like phospholipase family protein [Bacteroidales bacterium]HRX96974.1 patatin-like phospholipase family protein [Bacteroidales bacterium]
MNPIYRNLLLLFLLLPFLTFAQTGTDKNEAKRPKIGVVLSGGGAKGIAHIGILKAMEEEGLRPDFITGTSMGSIIGGLYALGYSADQLDSIIRSVNWDLVLSNNIPLNYIAYEEKEYYNRSIFEFQIEKGGLKLPSGLIDGQMLSENLTRFTWPAVKYDSFDDFPIPFRCIATDVSTGLPIVFKDGSLAKAIRSSMAIPTAFTAIDLDSTMVVDGGVVENFPVDEIIEMGADIIIGVSVGDGMKSAYDLSGMTDILFQVSMIPSLSKMDGQIEKCDIYIRPDLLTYSTGSFGNYEEILDLGYAAGELYRESFREIFEKYQFEPFVVKPLKVDHLHYNIVELDVKGNKRVKKELILSKLGIELGQDVYQGDIENGVREIFGTTNFSKVTYELTRLNEYDDYRLTIFTYEKNPATIKGSVHYDNVFSAGIVLNTTLRNIIGKSSRTIVTGDISDNPKFRLDYLKYMGFKQKFALNARYNFLNRKIPYYVEGALNDVTVSYLNSFSLGFITTQSLHHSLYAGATYEINNQKSKFNYIVPEGIKKGNFDFLRAELLYTINSANDRNYPTNGKELIIRGQTFLKSDYYLKFEKGVDTVFLQVDAGNQIYKIPFSEKDINDLIIKPATPGVYGQAEVRYKQYIPLNPATQIVPQASAGVTLSNDSSAIFSNFIIGGLQRINQSDITFMGLNYAEVDFENYIKGGLFLQNILLKNFYLKYGANILMHHEHVAIDQLEKIDLNNMINKNTVLGYGAEITMKSFLGPISLAVSRNSLDRHYRIYFAIGFSFNYTD